MCLHKVLTGGGTMYYGKTMSMVCFGSSLARRDVYAGGKLML